MTWRSPDSVPLSASEMARVHELHVWLRALGCLSRPTDLYDECACGRAKYHWLQCCRQCHDRARRARDAAAVAV